MGKSVKKNPFFQILGSEYSVRKQLGGWKEILVLLLQLSMFRSSCTVQVTWFWLFSFSFIALQSKFLKLSKEKIISVNATYVIHSLFILPVVCNSDILGQSAPSSNWRRGWSWRYLVFSFLFLSTLWFVYNFHAPKRSWF